jgi:hypothetical protein
LKSIEEWCGDWEGSAASPEDSFRAVVWDPRKPMFLGAAEWTYCHALSIFLYFK